MPMPDGDVRYGVYLRPSVAMCRAQAEWHELLRRQYGLRAAGAFMPHATIKGSFRSDAAAEEIAARVEQALTGRRPVEVVNSGVIGWPGGIVLNIQYLADGADNAPLRDLHLAVCAAIQPLIHPDCDFSPREWAGDRFVGHLTLAMADIPAHLFAEILAFVQAAAPVGPPAFLADTIHLVAFASDDWAGRYWESLRWEILHAWRLK